MTAAPRHLRAPRVVGPGHPRTLLHVLLCRNGDMTVMVDDINNAIDRISQLAVQKKGFVVSSKVSPSGQGTTGSISIRILPMNSKIPLKPSPRSRLK